MIGPGDDAGKPADLFPELGTLFNHLRDEAELAALAPETVAGNAGMAGAGAFPPGEVYDFAATAALLGFLRIHVEWRIAEGEVEVLATTDDAFEKPVVVFLMFDFDIQRAVFRDNLLGGIHCTGVDLGADEFPVVAPAADDGIDTVGAGAHIEDAGLFLLAHKIGEVVDVIGAVGDGWRGIAFRDGPALDIVVVGKQCAVQHEHRGRICEINRLVAVWLLSQEIFELGAICEKHVKIVTFGVWVAWVEHRVADDEYGTRSAEVDRKSDS